MAANPENLPGRVAWVETEPKRYVSEPSPQGGLEEAAARGNRLMLRFVLTQGADPDAVSGAERWNTLQKGIFWNWSFKGLKMLAARVSDIDFRDRAGRTALHLAVHYNRPDVAELLLQKGANPQAVSMAGATPLSLARAETRDVFYRIFAPYTEKPQGKKTLKLARISRQRNTLNR